MNDQRTQPKDYYIAFGCFLFCGIVALFIDIESLIPMNTGVAGSLGFLVLIPMSILSIVALLIGIWKTIVLPKQAILSMLAVISVLWVVEIISEFGSALFYNLVNWIYGTVVILFPLWWFYVNRNDYKKNT